jgi:hypothetical protein
MVTNPRTLRAMTKQGFIEWTPGIDRHWSGQRVRVTYVHAGPKLQNWSDTFRYRGHDYRLHYVDGCFKPFVFRTDERLPAFV